MGLNTSGPKPLLSIRFGGMQTNGLCDIFFQTENNVIKQFNNNQSLHSLTLDPAVLVSPTKTLQDLVGSVIGFNAIFTNVPGSPIQFSLTMDIQQSGASIITPIFMDDSSSGIIKSVQSYLVNGSVTIS
jgi:hypothetical protein